MNEETRWWERLPDGHPIKEWHKSWLETEERVRKEMEKGPLGTRTPESEKQRESLA